MESYVWFLVCLFQEMKKKIVVLKGAIKMENMDIRNKIVDLRLKNYEVAREIGVTANTFCRWLQVPLTPVKRELIERTIRKLCEKNKEISY